MKNTILILHGFNSAPGGKKEVINQWLVKNDFSNRIELKAPLLPIEPLKAIEVIEGIIKESEGIVYLIGTSLGGFYANYIRAHYPDRKCIVHAINPSWEPSKTLQRVVNTEVTNYKTGEESFFSSTYISQLEKIEKQILENLKVYHGNEYYIHIGTEDELLEFESFFKFLNYNQLAYKKYEYPTNHRFEMMGEMLENFVLKIKRK
jgi:predicted esterase YcpF (UPF0227 family)